MPFAFEELSFVHVTVLHVLLTLALFQVVHELPLVRIACVRDHLALPTGAVVYKLSLVCVTIGEEELAVATHFVGYKGTFVYVLVGPSVLAFALHHALVHLTLVDVAVLEIVLADPVLLAVGGLPFVDAIIVLDVLLQKLESVSHLFLPKNLLGKILQLPQYNLECPICDTLRRYKWKFSTIQQYIQLLQCKCPILILLELLQSFQGLIQILFPVKHILDNLPRRLDIVGIKVYLPKGLNVELSFFDQQPVPRFRIIFQLIDSLVHFPSQLFAHDLNKLVQFNEIVILAQFLLYFVVFGFGWPVVHLPQVTLLQLFNCNQIELAFLVGELCEADRAQQRALLAVWAQADNFDLLVFVLLVQAGQLGLDAQLRGLGFHAMGIINLINLFEILQSKGNLILLHFFLAGNRLLSG